MININYMSLSKWLGQKQELSEEEKVKIIKDIKRYINGEDMTKEREYKIKKIIENFKRNNI